MALDPKADSPRASAQADEPRDDSDLVRRFQAGDRAACAELLSRHRDRLYRLALAWLNSSSDAEDVVQEVFVRALRGLKDFRFEAQPFSWFYRTCRFVCMEHNRRRRPEPLTDEPAATTGQPDDVAAHAQLQQRMRQALGALSEQQRDVVLLYYFEGLSVRDCAQILELSEGSVKRQLHRARARLKDRLAP